MPADYRTLACKSVWRNLRKRQHRTSCRVMQVYCWNRVA